MHRQFVKFGLSLLAWKNLWLPTKRIHADVGQDMNQALKNGFQPFQDEESLRYAVDLVCAKYGKVKSLQIYPASRDSRGGGRQCLCMMQLDSPQAQAALRLELEVSISRNELAFFADVNEKWTGPSN